MNAAQAKDYVETVCGLDPGLPDTLFWRLYECASLGLILRGIQEGCEENHRGGEEADKGDSS